MKKKFYVVWAGIEPGIYDSWDAAKRQIEGFPAAKYKSFGDRAEAEKAYRGSFWAVAGKDTRTVKKSLPDLEKIGVRLDGVATDAACAGNPGDMEYRGVEIATGRELFKMGPLAEGTNNIGEFLALVHALAFLKKIGQPNRVIYTDSRNAMSWIRAKKCRTKLARTTRNPPIFELIERAENWLAANPVTNPILKWETEKWGEIPADYGRK